MKKFAWVVAVISLIVSSPVSAIGGAVTDPNAPLPLGNTPMIITAFSGSGTLDFIELNNQSYSAVDISGWKVRVVTAGGTPVVESESDIALPSGYLLPDSFVALGRDSLVAGADATFSLTPVAGESLVSLELYDAGNSLRNSVTPNLGYDAAKWYQRKSGTSGLSGSFTDFTAKTGPATLRGHGMYMLPPALSGVKIVELQPRPKDCAPNDSSLLCRDYIKLFNETNSTIDLGDYRLRTDSGTSASGNTFHLGAIGPGSYLSVWRRDDGSALSLTNDGGYAWFEDAEGVMRYDDTLANWPDASADSRQGQSWALDDTGAWRWSTTPQPDAANSFPVVLSSNVTSDLAPCPAGKYRSLETNRCRTVEEAIAVLAACDVGEVRNPETNRCRKVATLATAQLTPCDEGQQRNPSTNRCRSIASTASDEPKPCDEGQERNPETNRCRAVASSSSQATTFTEPKQEDDPAAYWTLIAGVSAVAVGYAVYEWRRELSKGLAWVVAKVKH